MGTKIIKRIFTANYRDCACVYHVKVMVIAPRMKCHQSHRGYNTCEDQKPDLGVIYHAL